MVTYQEGQWRGQRLSCTRRRRCPDCDLVSKLLCHLRAWPLDPPPVAAPAGHRRRPTARRIRKGGCGDGNVQREGEDGADTTHDGDGANGQVNDTAADGAQSQLMVAPDEVGGRGASTYKMSESSMAAVARRLVERNTGYGCETKRGEGCGGRGQLCRRRCAARWRARQLFFELQWARLGVEDDNGGCVSRLTLAW